MSDKWTQALVRGGRTLGAALIATAIATLPQLAGYFELNDAYTTALIVALTTFLNFLGKLLRDPTIAVTDVDAGRAAVAKASGVENASSTPLPF